MIPHGVISCHIPIKKAFFCDTKPVFYPSFLKLKTIKKARIFNVCRELR